MTHSKKQQLSSRVSFTKPDPRPCTECGKVVHPMPVEAMGFWMQPDVLCNDCLMADKQAQRLAGIQGATLDYLKRAGIKARHLAKLQRLIDSGQIELPGLKRATSNVAKCTFDPLSENWAWLVGRPGTGKTTQLILLAYHVVHQALERDQAPPYVRYTSELEMTMDFKNFDLPRDQVIKRYMTPRLLLIDEAGRGRGTPHEYNIWWRIIDGRYSEGLATVFASNYALSPIPRHGIEAVPNSTFYDDTITSRIMEMMGENVSLLVNDVRFGGGAS